MLGAILAVAAGALTGCGIGSERLDPFEIQVRQLERDKTGLVRDLELARAENVQLAEQIKALAARPGSERDNAYRLETIRLMKYTNFYDKNDDGTREKLIIYAEPVDADGDAIKAPGTVNVQLWNLNKINGQALVGQWQVDPPELRRLWFDTLISASYRLMFDAPAQVDVLTDQLTVKVTFTDILTGEIFRAQHVIEPLRYP